MPSPPSFTVISIGGGVQSSTMPLVAFVRAFGGVLDGAVFTDTRCEPPCGYERGARLLTHRGENVPQRLRRLRRLGQHEETRFDAGRPIGVSWPYQVGPAMLTTPRAAAPPEGTGDANRLYYSQTRSPAGGGSFSI